MTAFGSLSLLHGRPPPSRVPRFLPLRIEAVPSWASAWAAGDKGHCGEGAPSAERVQGLPHDLAARYQRRGADHLAGLGLQCIAADNLLALARSVEKRDTPAARQSLEAALALALLGDDTTLLARIAKQLAILEANEQNARRSLELGFAASFLWQRAGNFEKWSTSRYDLGVLLLWMGRFDEAEELLSDLLRSLSGAPDCCQSLVAPTLTILGRIDIAQGELDSAAERLTRSRDARRAEEVRGLAATLDALCRLRIHQRDFHRAEELNRQVRELVRGELRSEANALATQAEISLALARAPEAVALARRARRLLQRSGGRDPNLELHSFFVEAEAQRALAHRELADADMEALMARLEAYRQSGEGPLAVPFFAARRRYVSTWIDDLVARGRATDALDVAEWTRARGLLDGLVAPPAEIRRLASPATLAMDTRLRDELATLGARVEALGAANGPVAMALGAQARSIRLALLAVEASMRRAAGTLPSKPIGWREAQKLLDDGTLVLYYCLGEDRSFVWAIEADRFEVHADLPGHRPLQRAANRLRDLLSKGEASRHEVRTELGALSEALLAPVAPRLRAARAVVVVPDGELGEIPFAALPEPLSHLVGGDPLMKRVPVTVVHSLSVLAAIRAHAAERRQRQALTFVAVADPVYGPADRRFPARRRGHSPALAASRRRLEGSGREVERVFRRLDPRAARLYTGIDANRQRVLAGDLDGSRFVHLGAHAELDWADPELSAIHLSVVDAAGRPVDGALRLQDLERLRLAADLVVLAGCRTGSGRSYLGEGPLALPRGFLAAGAASVVATLWDVDDEPTAVFFERFWSAILEQGLPPAQALRAAQLELAQSRRWQDPSYWAGFVLLGDWSG